MSPYDVYEMFKGTLDTMGIVSLSWQMFLMWAVAGFFLYLAIVKNFEPLLLLPIGFGIFIVNFPMV
ncbi:MAG: sodium ion-translocating decarboxylase subunit beta, partial [Syntrophaceae bacterium]|nr:sodium ion-translocating decarboxylase subunit beta [Syntrophaceae bacterium]